MLTAHEARIITQENCGFRYQMRLIEEAIMKTSQRGEFCITMAISPSYENSVLQTLKGNGYKVTNAGSDSLFGDDAVLIKIRWDIDNPQSDMYNDDLNDITK